MPSGSFGEFEQLLNSVDQLIAIHGKLQQGRGRRYEQSALHRAGVVLTVAAWQAYVEKLIVEGIERIELQVVAPINGLPAPPWAIGNFRLRKAAIKKSVSTFNTPNSENVRRLFVESFDFDVRPHWIWHAPRRHWDPAEFCEYTNCWLNIRHSIAHGDDLPEIGWIRGNNGEARLTLQLLSECKRHFLYLAAKTDEAFSNHLQNHFDVPEPW